MPIRRWCCEKCNKAFPSFGKAERHENACTDPQLKTSVDAPEQLTLAPVASGSVSNSQFPPHQPVQADTRTDAYPLELTVHQLFEEMYQSRCGFSKAYFTNPLLRGRQPEIHPTRRRVLILRKTDATPSTHARGTVEGIPRRPPQRENACADKTGLPTTVVSSKARARQ